MVLFSYVISECDPLHVPSSIDTDFVLLFSTSHNELSFSLRSITSLSLGLLHVSSIMLTDCWVSFKPSFSLVMSLLSPSHLHVDYSF